MKLSNKLEQLEQDFEQGNGPFADVQFPEERLLETLYHNDDEEKLQTISLFATLDYNRDANQLVDKIIALRDDRLFRPTFVAENEEYVREAFNDVAFRYKNRDTDAWVKNNRILVEQYDGEWSNLIEAVDYDAPSLVQQLNDNNFSVLKGAKVAPMYARIISDEVHELSNVWQLDIPVDTHIRRLSKDLFAAHALAPETKFNDDDFIRSLWREVADDYDVSRHVVDGALWHIGNKWDDWGEGYWNEVTA